MLIIHPDTSEVDQMLAIFQRSACIVIQSLDELHGLDLSAFDIAICSDALADGSGLDALAYIQGTRPELPVILTGCDSSMTNEAIQGGAMDYLIASSASDWQLLPLAVEKCLVHQRIKQENEQLHRDLRRSLAELAATNQELQAVIRQLEAMATTDELTGLSNRRWLNLVLQGHWAEATRSDLPLACLMIDLDGFKQVNDLRGHHCGDDALRMAAKVIRANCREVDIAARYGGDEFCILLPNTKPIEAAQVAERILKAYDKAISGRPADEPRVSMSIGVSHVDLTRPINAEQLVSHADEALYAAKAAGKRQVVVCRTSQAPA